MMWWRKNREQKKGAIDTVKHEQYRMGYGHFGVQGSMGYHSASVMANVDGTTPGRASGNWHEQASRDRLVNQSREFYRDNLLYGGIINRCVDFVIGNGYEIVANNPDVAAMWNTWFPYAEITQRYNGVYLPRAVMRERLLTGEGICLKVKGGMLQLCEAEQIISYAGAMQGVETDEYNKPIKYHMASYVDGMLGTPKPVSAENVIYMMEPERPSSVRGVPVAQTAFAMLHRINDVLDSEALTWQLLSRLAMKHTSATNTPFGTTTNNGGLNVLEMPYSIIFEGSDVEDLSPIDYNRPGKDFPASVSAFCRFLGLPFGMPLELVLNDFTKLNFSQMRGALVLAHKSFERLVAGMVIDFYDEVFNWKFNEWATAGDIEDTPENKKHSWVTPQFPWIDELQEANAIEKKIGLGLMTYEEACKTLEHQMEDVRETRKREIIEAIQISKDIEAETGERVPWQIFAGVGVGKTEEAAKVEADAKAETDANAEAENGTANLAGNEDEEEVKPDAQPE